MGIPTTGGNLWSVTSPYPWMGDPLFTDAWIADRQYLDSGTTVGIVSPQKGSISLVQATGANKPAYSAAWGSLSKGMLTFDGVDDWLSGDALAAKVTGNPAKDFTIIQSFDMLAIGDGKSPWSFSDSSNVAKLVEFNIKFTSHQWESNQFDDAAHPNTSNPSPPIVATTGRLVATCSYYSASARFGFRFNGVDVGSTSSNTSMGQTTLSKFTLGAFRGSSLTNTCNMRWRSTVFSPLSQASPASLVSRSEQFLINE